MTASGSFSAGPQGPFLPARAEQVEAGAVTLKPDASQGPVVLPARPKMLLQAVVGAVLIAVAGFCFAHGKRVDRWPAYVAGTDHTDVTRWSGPWIGGAVGLFMVGLLLITLALINLVRRVWLGRALSGSVGGPVVGGPVVGEPVTPEPEPGAGTFVLPRSHSATGTMGECVPPADPTTGQR